MMVPADLQGDASSALALVDVPADDVVAENLILSLQEKGFACVNSNADGKTLLAAAEEARRLQSADYFAATPAEILDGLLGQEGSAQTCGLSDGDLDLGDGTGPKHLEDLDAYLTSIAGMIQPMAEPYLGLTIQSRSVGLLHQAGEAEDACPTLGDMEANTWLDQFVKQRLMLLYFLGSGTLELTPVHDEEAMPYQVETQPGMVVVIRADALLHTFTSSRRCYVLSCFLNQDTLDAERRDDLDQHVVPCVRELMAWIQDRIRQLAEMQEIGEFGQEWPEDVPRHWQSFMNHTFNRAPQVACRGMAVKFPGHHDPDATLASVISGCDYAATIPISRWNHEDFHDPDTRSWMWNKTYARHACFMEGVELFDAKVFNLSAHEAKGMDPCQRHVLEVAYEGLVRSGMTKKSMMRSLTGMYIGASQTEFIYAPSEGGTGTSCAGAITSNRVNFCLGLQGPSITIDCGAASFQASLSQAHASLAYQTDRYIPNHTAVSGSVRLTLSGPPMVLMCGMGWLDPQGRCLCFDATANGWVKSEGVGVVVKTKQAARVDGEEAADDDRPLLGSVAAANMNQAGRGSSLSAPSGPQLQDLIMQAVRQACISPLDVDAVECHGEGGISSDSIECTSLERTLRDQELVPQPAAPLMVASVKTGYGHMVESAGIVQMVKVLCGMRFGVQAGGLHLYELNPHIDAWEGQPLGILTEAVNNRHLSAFVGMLGRSATGSMAHAIAWGSTDWQQLPARKQVLRDSLTFWPGGGGELEDGAEPDGNYTIVGSWSEWFASEPMREESPGVFVYTVTLGANRFERFQIRLDGLASRALHPAEADQGRNSVAHGPDDEEFGLSWMIDGRPFDDEAALTNGGDGVDSAMTGEDTLQNPWLGEPGDRYRVVLKVAGKWRSVTWDKVSADGAEMMRRRAEYVDDGKYYLSGTWNAWDFQEMARSGDGTYTAEVTLPSFSEQFQVVRNMDFGQTFFPAEAKASSGAEAWGPEYGAEGLAWYIRGSPGDVFTVEFQRAKAEPSDQIKVCWRKKE